VKVWDAQTGQELLSLQKQTGFVSSVAFSPDGTRIATVGEDGSNQRKPGEVNVWDAQTGQQLLVLKGHSDFVRSVCFSPDGKRIASTSQKEVKLWDAQTGQEVLSLQGGSSVCFSPDGTRLASGAMVKEARSGPVDDWFQRRLADDARNHYWHLLMAQQARRQRDDFGLAFHLKPLLLTAFTRWRHRPPGSFPLWVSRPPLARGSPVLPDPADTSRPARRSASEPVTVLVSEPELRKLVEELSRQLAAEPQAWAAWAARGWCRHLLNEANPAVADLKRAIALQKDEPGLWAVLGTVCLKHNQLAEAAAVHKRLAEWPGVKVALWHSVEADACEAEAAWGEVYWHLSHLVTGLPSPSAALFVRRGQLLLSLGREKEATADFARAFQQNDEDIDIVLWHARSCLLVADQQAYQQACAALLKSFTAKDAPPSRLREAAPLAARTVMLSPEAVPELGPALTRAMEPPQDLPRIARRQDSNALTAQGGLLLRAGRYPEAITTLQEAIAKRFRREAPVAELLLAIAQYKQGQAAEARRTLDRVRFTLDREAPLRDAIGLVGGAAAGPWHAAARAGAGTRPEAPPWDLPTQLEVRLLRREAESLINLPAPQPNR
jgi:tetratricopeptide (TPR) repeat protein